jgi:hypothetical protein
MATNIKYEVLSPANLKLKNVQQEQIKVYIDITGAETDPLTLQQIYEEQSLQQCFLARSKNINMLVQGADAEVAKATDKKEQERLLKEMNDKVAAQVKTLGQEMQVRANAFIAKQKKEVNDFYWVTVKMAVRCGYNVGKLTLGALNTTAKVVTVATVPGAGMFVTAGAIKGIIDNVRDVYKLYHELQSYLDGELEVRKKLKSAVVELRKLKPPAKVPQDKIDGVSSLLIPYSVRLAGIDMQAKQLATQLDALLKKLEKKKFRFKRHQELAENEVDKSIQEIIKLSQTVTKGRGLVQNAKDAVKTASQRVQKDPPSFYSNVGATLWKALDFVFGAGEEVEKTKGIWQKMEGGAKSLLESLQQEMQDAIVEEHTN